MANALLIFRSGSTISDALCLAMTTASDICSFFNYIFFPHFKSHLLHLGKEKQVQTLYFLNKEYLPFSRGTAFFARKNPLDNADDSH